MTLPSPRETLARTWARMADTRRACVLTTGGAWTSTVRRATSSSARGCSREQRGRPPRWRSAAAANDAAVPLLADGAEGRRPPARRAEHRKKLGERDDRRRRRRSRRSRPASPTSASSSTTTSRSTRRKSRSARPSRRRELLQARSPSLDLDSLYGAGPQDPESAKFYEADGVHLKTGKTVAVGGDAAQGRLRPAARRRRKRRPQKRKAVIPDPRNDENLAVAQTHLAMIRFHNRVVDTLPASVPHGAALRAGARARHQALPVDDPHATSCRASARQAVVNDVFANGRKAFEVGATPIDVPTMPIEFSVAATGSATRWCAAPYNWNARFDDGAGTLDFLFLFSADQRRPRRRAAAAEQLDRRLPAPLRLHGGRTGRPRRAGEKVQPRDAHRHAARGPAENLPTGSFGGPAVPFDDPRRTSRSATSRARRW